MDEVKALDRIQYNFSSEGRLKDENIIDYISTRYPRHVDRVLELSRLGTITDEQAVEWLARLSQDDIPGMLRGLE